MCAYIKLDRELQKRRRPGKLDEAQWQTIRKRMFLYQGWRRDRLARVSRKRSYVLALLQACVGRPATSSVAFHDGPVSLSALRLPFAAMTMAVFCLP